MINEQSSRQIAEQLDQFFTKESLAKSLFQILQSYLLKEKIEINNWLEPSAGSGAFFKLMPLQGRLGVDIAPQIEGIVQSDFLQYQLPNKPFITLGNPPFGKNSSLAIKFFNKCATVSEVIAFVVPKTFNKQSTISKLDRKFHLDYSEDLPENSFELQGQPYDVPCVFQIWRKKEVLREKAIIIRKHEDFIFCDRAQANFAIQRVGVNAGALKKDLSTIASQSHYFIKAETEEVEKLFLQINWNCVKYNTAGNPSIAKGELIDLYIKEKNINNLGK